MVDIVVPGRICLLGDKADLMGYPVIACAVDLEMNINLQKANDGVIRFYSKDIKECEQYSVHSKLAPSGSFKYLTAAYSRLEEKISSGFAVNISSQIPIGSGMSSSAAITVGFIKALNLEYCLGLKTGEIAELAYLAEHDDCKISCGRMDQYSIAFGGATFIDTKKPSVEALNIGSLPIIIANSNEPRSAKKVLNETMDLINSKNCSIIDCFERVYNGVIKGKEALINRDYEMLGKLMNAQQEIENEFNGYLSTPSATPKLNLLCQTALDNGALGAKQMGAGGGGCMIALAIENREKIAKALENQGATIYQVNVFNY
jgi:mevalonate kinase